MNLEQYIDAVKATLANSPIIASIEVIDERILLGRGYFRARLTLINADFLEIAESFTIETDQLVTLGHLEKYRFFWEWQRDLKGSSLLKAAKWQLIEVPTRLSLSMDG